MKKSKLMTSLVYLYIALPFLIFAFGFLGAGITTILSLGVVFSLFFAIWDSKALTVLPFEKKDFLKIFGGLLFITVLVILSGIGNVMWQNNDHATRNTLFDILVNFSWPPKMTVNGNEVGLVYYIGFWLPSALFGKLTSLQAGYVFQIVWTILGLALLWYLLCLFHKKIVFYPLLIFFFFSGLDRAGHLLVTLFGDSLTNLQIGKWTFSQGSFLSYHLEWWARSFQYSSHITQLFWVFNQCLPVWLATLLIILEKNNKNLVFIMGLTLLSSTLPFIGLIPVFFWCAFTSKEEPLLSRSFLKGMGFFKAFLSLFSFQNLLGGGFAGIVTFLYLKSNIATASTSSQSSIASASAASFSLVTFLAVIAVGVCLYLFIKPQFKPSQAFLLAPLFIIAYKFASLPTYKMGYYLLFIAFEVVILAIIPFSRYKDTSLYWITISCLLTVPFFVLGTSIDFCMRASIPLLVVLCLLVTDSVKHFKESNNRTALILAVIILAIGAINPIHEIIRTIEATAFQIQTNGKVVNKSIATETVFKSRNFTGKTEDNFFFEVLANK